MSDRKSSRPRKSICYATLGNESESDDDFAPSSSSKKQKTVNKKEDTVKKEKKNGDSKPPSSLSKSLPSIPSSILKRHSNFDDELQKALELSLLETSTSQNADEPGTDNNIECESNNSHPVSATSHNQDHIVKHVKVDIEPIPSASRLEEIESKMPDLSATSTHDQSDKGVVDVDDLSTEPPKLVPVINTSVCVAVIDDTIESVQSSAEGCDRGRRKRTLTKRETVTTKPKLSSTKKRIIDDDDDKNSVGSDFAPDDNDESDSDDDEEDEEDDFSPSDNDSDFDDGKKRTKKKPVPKDGKKISSTSVSAKSPKPTNTNAGVKKSQKTSNKESSSSKAVNRNSITRKAPNLGGTPVLPSGTSSALPASISSTPLSSPSSSLPASALSSPVTPQSWSNPGRSTKPSPSTPSMSRGLVGRQWKPPGHQSASNNSSPATGSASLLKSSSSGLRLGLSRNQRVKPLHDSVKVV